MLPEESIWTKTIFVLLLSSSEVTNYGVTREKRGNGYDMIDKE